MSTNSYKVQNGPDYRPWTAELTKTDLPAAMVRRVSRAEGLEAFVAALEEDGCVVVKDFTDPDTLKHAQQEVQPYLDAQGPGSKVGALNGGTATCTRLVGRSRTVREKFFSDPLFQVRSQ